MKFKIRKKILYNSYVISIYKLYKKILFKLLGSIVLIQTVRLFNFSNINYFLTSGTLLGLIREGNLLKHDIDIDFGIDPSELNRQGIITNLLKNAGFKHKASWYIDSRLVEQSFSKYGVKIDIFYYLEDENFYYHFAFFRTQTMIYKDNIFDSVKFNYGKVKKKIYINYKKNLVRIPENYEFHLETNYGVNWHIKDTNYNYTKAPNAQITDKLGLYVKI